MAARSIQPLSQATSIQLFGQDLHAKVDDLVNKAKSTFSPIGMFLRHQLLHIYISNLSCMITLPALYEDFELHQVDHSLQAYSPRKGQDSPKPRAQTSSGTFRSSSTALLISGTVRVQ